MIQFGVIPQRFKQEMGRGQGHAAGRGKQEASKKAGKAAWNKAALKDPSKNTALRMCFANECCRKTVNLTSLSCIKSLTACWCSLLLLLVGQTSLFPLKFLSSHLTCI